MWFVVLQVVLGIATALAWPIIGEICREAREQRDRGKNWYPDPWFD
jgi:hypothetical protein